MTRTIAQIKDELARIAGKIAELIGLRSTVDDDLKSLQDGFVSDKVTADQLQAKQAELASTNSTIELLETRKSELMKELKGAEVQKATSEKIDVLKNAAEAGKVVFDEYMATVAEFDSVIADYAKRLFEKKQAFTIQKRLFTNTLREIPDAIQLESISPDAIATVRDQQTRVPKSRFSEYIALIEGGYEREVERQRRKASHAVA